MENSIVDNKPSFTNMMWFSLTILILVIHYLHPQDYVGLSNLAPYSVLTLLLFGFLFLTKSNIIQWQHSFMRYVWLTFFIFFITTPFAENPRASLGISRIMFFYLPTILSMLVLITNVRRLRFVVDTFILIAVISSIVTIVAVSGDGGTTGNKGFLENANEYALFVSMLVPCCYFMFLYERSSLKKIIYIMSLSVILLGLILSYSRAGLVAVVVSSVIIWWYSPHKLITSLLGLVFIVLALVIGGEQYTKEMSTIADTDYSTTNLRLEMWKKSWDKFIEHPFGSGLQSSRVAINRRGDLMENHSIWLATAVETGIFGLMIFIGMWITMIRSTLHVSSVSSLTTKQFDEEFRYLRFFGKAMLGALVAYAVAGTFTHAVYYPHFWYFCALIAAATKVVYNLNKEVKT